VSRPSRRGGLIFRAGACCFSLLSPFGTSPVDRHVPMSALSHATVLGWDFEGPTSVVVDGKDLFVADNASGSLTEVRASTGALVRVLSGPQYGFDFPFAMALDGPDLFVANAGSQGVSSSSGTESIGSVTEVDASTGAVVRVASGPKYGFDTLGRWSPTARTCSSPTPATAVVPGPRWGLSRSWTPRQVRW
jgi:hypothetical protein